MSKSILVVDDSPSVRQVVGLSLKNAGYQVVEAEDGMKALEALDGRRFHLIISDVNMPIMDGLSFVKQLKQKDAYRFTPVLMLTTESGDDMKQAGKAAGVKAWLVKPFKPDVLLSAVSKLA
ncbi:two-component system chemotaxis response regulator CheY [Idiomarina fontislapidosi]|uniref:Two-component system response regulator n=1 Tax=Idiomarina fontislapidosi TaxID=263723 RepID=A0A432YAY6_9GAMM|nr:response regulator [Idiomarina fontislapidosi]PYE35176.1 two-component system chemotaxis response regulator CheY [Idiomarina fontislapidosi]RUO58071.1 two-component system response regulator [Idiomarina fontislapidosi]